LFAGPADDVVRRSRKLSVTRWPESSAIPSATGQPGSWLSAVPLGPSLRHEEW